MNGLDSTLTWDSWMFHMYLASVYSDTNGGVKNGVDLVLRHAYNIGQAANEILDEQNPDVDPYSFQIVCHPKLEKHFQAFVPLPEIVIRTDQRVPYRSARGVYSHLGDKEYKFSNVVICPLSVTPFSESEYDSRLTWVYYNLEDWKW